MFKFNYKIICICLGVITQLAFQTSAIAAIYNCKLLPSDSTQLQETPKVIGNVKILTKSSNAKITLLYKNQKFKYNNCKRINDDFGVLIDCNTGNLDLMILLSTKVRPTTGGVMSSTHNLFSDLKC